MADYPTDLPCFLRGHNYQKLENIQETAMADGNALGRQRFPDVPRVYTVSLSLTAAELLLWEAFVDGIGVTEFNAPVLNHQTQNTFVNGRPLLLVAVKLVSSTYTVTMIHADRWSVTNIKLKEVL